jgi:hypothetical protein
MEEAWDVLHFLEHMAQNYHSRLLVLESKHLVEVVSVGFL